MTEAINQIPNVSVKVNPQVTFAGHTINAEKINPRILSSIKLDGSGCDAKCFTILTNHKFKYKRMRNDAQVTLRLYTPPIYR